MDLIHPDVQSYLNALAPHADPLLIEMEERARETDFPIIGPAAGKLCYLIARMTGARRIFEMGSGFGYSTLWFARAVAENGGGEVYHTVWDESLSRDARQYIERAGLSHLVKFHVGEAVAALRETPGAFDLIFNDIDKEGYPASLPLIKEKLWRGGTLIMDNMLWGGRIFDGARQEGSTRGVREATRLLIEDPDWIVSLIPLRDGLALAVRK
ncbi:MAG: O-methyltransferase [Bacillota bacterium]